VLAYHLFDAQAYYGLLGVELFFVISGFVILMTLERITSVTEFAILRAARLYPAYWFSLAVASSILLTTRQADLREILINATMLQAFVPFPNLVNPYWTLAYEIVFYLAVATVFKARQIQRIDALAVCWLVFMILFKVTMLASGHGGKIFYNWHFQLLFMPQFGQLFIAGMMIHRINTGRATTLTNLALGLAILYSFFGRADWAQIDPMLYFAANAAFIALVWAASSGRAPWFSAPPLVIIGLSSYSLYLLHEPLHWLFSIFFADRYVWFKVLVELPVVICAAIIVRNYIELPADKWVKKIALARKAPERPAETQINTP
jgi:peptidoglycan/LPS O-acetylase OafA/YrhL